MRCACQSQKLLRLFRSLVGRGLIHNLVYMIWNDRVQRSSGGPWVLEAAIGCERSRQEHDELPIIRRSIDNLHKV